MACRQAERMWWWLRSGWPSSSPIRCSTINEEESLTAALIEVYEKMSEARLSGSEDAARSSRYLLVSLVGLDGHGQGFGERPGRTLAKTSKLHF